MYDIISNIYQTSAKVFTWETISCVNGSLQSYFIACVKSQALCFTWVYVQFLSSKEYSIVGLKKNKFFSSVALFLSISLLRREILLRPIHAVGMPVPHLLEILPSADHPSVSPITPRLKQLRKNSCV